MTNNTRRTGPIIGFLLDAENDETREELKQRLEILLMTFGLLPQGNTKKVISPCKTLNLQETIYRATKRKFGRGTYYATLRLIESTDTRLGFLPSLDLHPVHMAGGNLGYYSDGSITFFGAEPEIPEEFGSLLELPRTRIIQPYYVLPQEPQRKP